MVVSTPRDRALLLAHPARRLPTLCRCRAIDDGFLTSNFRNEPFTVWVASGQVAMLQLVGGVGGVVPSNVIEYLVFIAAVMLGTIGFAAVQGVIVQVMTTGDPDEIQFKQVHTRMLHPHIHPMTRVSLASSPP